MITPQSTQEELWRALWNPFLCMDARSGQFQKWYKRNRRQEKYIFYGDGYESHGLQTNQTKQY